MLPAALSLRPATNVSACRPHLWQRSLRRAVVVVIVVITVITVATTVFPPLSRDLFDCCVLSRCHVLSPSSSVGGHPIHRIIRCRCRSLRRRHCRYRCRCPHRLRPPPLPPCCCCRAIAPPPPSCRHQAAAAKLPPPQRHRQAAAAATARSPSIVSSAPFLLPPKNCLACTV